MSAILATAQENRLRFAADPVAERAWCDRRRRGHVLVPDRFARDTAPPTCRIVPQRPTADGSATSRHRCLPESFSSLPPHAQSAPAWLNRRVPKLSGAPPARNACIQVPPRAVLSPPTAQLRCPRARRFACQQDPV